MQITDLLLLTGAAYGFSWIITKSKIAAPVRLRMQDVPFLGELVLCIVCVSFWVGLALIAMLPWSSLFSPAVRNGSLPDMAYLIGWVVFSVWGLARILGDAD